jgi:hypothetical protein
LRLGVEVGHLSASRVVDHADEFVTRFDPFDLEKAVFGFVRLGLLAVECERLTRVPVTVRGFENRRIRSEIVPGLLAVIDSASELALLGRLQLDRREGKSLVAIPTVPPPKNSRTSNAIEDVACRFFACGRDERRKN